MLLQRIALAASFALLANAAVAQGFSDNEASYRYQPFSKEPGTNRGQDIPKNILNFTHVDAGKYYIDNFFYMDILQSNHDDPANGAANTGATEVYTFWRGDLSNSKVFGGNLAVPGFLRDVTLQGGVDGNTKNTTFAPEKKDIVIGPNFHFDTPGFFNAAVHFYKEWNYNGIVGRSVDFNPTAEFEFVWLVPLDFTGMPMRLEGFTNVTLPKGRDGFGNQTATEMLFRSQITIDIGAFFDKPHIYDAFVGYQWWINKFGNNHTLYSNVGSYETTPYFGVGVHF